MTEPGGAPSSTASPPLDAYSVEALHRLLQAMGLANTAQSLLKEVQSSVGSEAKATPAGPAPQPGMHPEATKSAALSPLSIEGTVQLVRSHFAQIAEFKVWEYLTAPKEKGLHGSGGAVDPLIEPMLTSLLNDAFQKVLSDPSLSTFAEVVGNGTEEGKKGTVAKRSAELNRMTELHLTVRYLTYALLHHFVLELLSELALRPKEAEAARIIESIVALSQQLTLMLVSPIQIATEKLDLLATEDEPIQIESELNQGSSGAAPRQGEMTVRESGGNSVPRIRTLLLTHGKALVDHMHRISKVVSLFLRSFVPRPSCPDPPAEGDFEKAPLEALRANLIESFSPLRSELLYRLVGPFLPLPLRTALLVSHLSDSSRPVKHTVPKVFNGQHSNGTLCGPGSKGLDVAALAHRSNLPISFKETSPLHTGYLEGNRVVQSPTLVTHCKEWSNPPSSHRPSSAVDPSGSRVESVPWEPLSVATSANGKILCVGTAQGDCVVFCDLASTGEMPSLPTEGDESPGSWSSPSSANGFRAVLRLAGLKGPVEHIALAQSLYSSRSGTDIGSDDEVEARILIGADRECHVFDVTKEDLLRGSRAGPIQGTNFGSLPSKSGKVFLGHSEPVTAVCWITVDHHSPGENGSRAWEGAATPIIAEPHTRRRSADVISSPTNNESEGLRRTQSHYVRAKTRTIGRSRYGRQFFSAAEDKFVLRWDVASQTIVQRFSAPTVFDMAFSSIGNVLLTLDSDSRLALYDGRCTDDFLYSQNPIVKQNVATPIPQQATRRVRWEEKGQPKQKGRDESSELLPYGARLEISFGLGALGRTEFDLTAITLSGESFAPFFAEGDNEEQERKTFTHRPSQRRRRMMMPSPATTAAHRTPVNAGRFAAIAAVSRTWRDCGDEAVKEAARLVDGRYLVLLFDVLHAQWLRTFRCDNITPPSVAKRLHRTLRDEGDVRRPRGRAVDAVDLNAEDDDDTEVVYNDSARERCFVMKPAFAGNRYLYTGTLDDEVLVFDVFSGVLKRRLTLSKDQVDDHSLQVGKPQSSHHTRTLGPGSDVDDSFIYLPEFLPSAPQTTLMDNTKARALFYLEEALSRVPILSFADFHGPLVEILQLEESRKEPRVPSARVEDAAAPSQSKPADRDEVPQLPSTTDKEVDLSSLAVLPQENTPHEKTIYGVVNSVALLPRSLDSKYSLVAIHDDGSVYVWN